MYKRTFTKKIISYLNEMIPKKNIILFDSYPDFCDNSWALYQYIIKDRKDICDRYKLVWAYSNCENTEKFNSERTHVSGWGGLA